MRNLKKVLSLALALVMLLGMMVVGAGAATKFQDVDKIQNKEAVAVLVGMGIMKGREDGTNFDPTGTLTRAEAAMMIAQMDLGVDAAAALKGNGSNTFSDVWAGYWAEGAIDYCVEQGYIKGDGAGHFLPGNPVSSVEFGSMALRLLGYDADNEGLVGDQWAVKAASLIRKAGLATSTAANTKPMTRDEMAQMAFNTLTAETVEYNGLNISGDNITITSPATVRRHSANQSNVNTTYDKEPIKSNITPIRFCEERFPTLKLDRSGENEFKEAYSVWTYRGVEIEDSKIALNCISTHKAEANNAWMTNVKTVSALKYAYVNGADITKNVASVNDITDLTGNGRLVEVYVYPDNLSSVEKVVVIDTVPGEVTKVAADGKLTIKLLETNGVNDDKSVDVKKNDLVTTNDKTVIDGEFKKGDLVLVNAYGKNPIRKDSTVAKVFAPEVREEFVIRKNYKDGVAISVDTGADTGIEDARNVISEFDIDGFKVNNKNEDSTLYLDKYGYIVKIIGWVDTTPRDGLIAIKDVFQDVEGRKIVNRVSGAIANGETIELVYDKEETGTISVGKVYVYTDDDKDGVYDLERVKDQKTPIAPNGKEQYVADVGASLSLSFRSNDTKGKESASKYFYSDSVKFIFADGNNGVTVLKGRQSYEFKGTVLAQALDKNGEISAVFLEATPDFVDLNDIIFVWARKSKDEVVGSDKQTIYYGYEAYNSDGTEIEDFLGTEDNMDLVDSDGNLIGRFYRKNTVKDGDIIAYKPDTSSTKLKNHTLVSGVITYANSTNNSRGDAFIINGGTKNPMELLTNSKTVVVDLATDGTITDAAELNQTMNKEHKAVTVAVVYTEDTVNHTNDVHTIFVTDVGDTGSYNEIKPGETPSEEEVTVKFDGTAVKGTHYTVEGLTDDKIESGKTFTVKGTDIEMSNGAGYTVKAVTGGYEVTVIAANKTEITVTVDQKGQTSTTNVKFKGGVSTMNGAKIGLSNALVASDGKVVINFILDVPSWVIDNNADTANKVTYNVKVNGKQVVTGATTATGTGMATANGLMTAQINNAVSGFATPTNAEVEVEITKVEYKEVQVKYVDKDGVTDITDKLGVAANIKKIATNATSLTVAYTSSDTTTAHVPVVSIVSGATGTVPAATNKAGAISCAITGMTVAGDAPVVIKVDESAMTKSYKITIDDTAGADLKTTGVKLSEFGITNGDKDETVKLSVAAGKDTVAEGGMFANASLQVTISGAAKKGFKYIVSVDGFGEAVVPGTNDGSTAVSFDGNGVTMTKDVNITKGMVHVTLLEDKIAIDGTASKWDATNRTLTIVFNVELDKTAAETKTNYTFTDGSTGGVILSSAVLGTDKKSVILTFDGDITETGTADKVVVGVGVISAKTAAETNAADQNRMAASNNTVTLAAKGAVAIS